MPPTVALFKPATGASETWHLVALGDSNVSGWGINVDVPYSPEDAYPGVYAGLLAEEQGVDVILHSYYPDQMGSELRTVDEWADVLARDPSMRQDLGAANLVTILIGFHDVLPALLWNQCGTEWPAMRACLAGVTDLMPAAFDRLYGDIRSLVPAEATVLVHDYSIPGPVYERWSSAAFWPELKPAIFDVWRDALEIAAEEHGFRLVHTYAALSDAAGRPTIDWSSITSDGWHFNSKGHQLIAELVQAQDGLD